LERHWQRESLTAALGEYSDIVLQEIQFIDRIVHGCYLGSSSFRLFAAYCMLYFTSAVTYEARRRERAFDAGPFLCAGDADLQALVLAAYEAMQRLAARKHGPEDELEFEGLMRTLIAPYNRAGLLDPKCQNMYRHTAAR
jgi:FADH2 O2-dependent halogenase